MGRLRLGCAGWAYDEWVGPVYPKGLPANERLRAYATRFDLVELDSTFYAVPAPAVVAGWLGQVAERPDFRFAAKLPRVLTHEALLDGDWERVEGVLEEFLEVVVRPLEDARRFDSVLAQLPPQFHASSAALATAVERLAGLLARLAAQRRHVAVEFRHPSWFAADGALQRPAREALESVQAGLVLVDGLGFRFPPTRTAPWSYFRLHGRSAGTSNGGREAGKGPYSAAQIPNLAAGIQDALRKDDSTSVIFTYHDAGTSAKNAVALLESLGRPTSGLPIPPRGARSLKDFT